MSNSVSVFGLGYVGCVSAACLAREGHRVVGVDVSKSKVDMINAGTATIVETGIGELVAEMVAAGKLTATTDVAKRCPRRRSRSCAWERRVRRMAGSISRTCVVCRRRSARR
jgi:UDP-glucose 6-dehydrogenase